MHHRREIDGLRAIAVLPVILFHAGFAAFSGGFVGVDVFFVISGYLITSILLEEKSAGTFSIVQFYERRARRILPALFVVLATCIPFAWAWLLPPDTKTFALSIASVALFISNIFFANQSGYFDAAAELNPLLHAWSLSVEEQFYLLFPLGLTLAWRWGKTVVTAALLACAIASFALAQREAQDGAAAAFYMLSTRAWELLTGALVACVLERRPQAAPGRATGPGLWVSQSLSLLGVLMIGGSIVMLDRHTPFPGVHALWTVAGTSLVLAFATSSTFVGRVLSSRLLVGIGLISYSAYLWHQPLLAFARLREGSQPSALLMGSLSAAALLLAYGTWRFIENPLRDRSRFARRTVLTWAAAGCLGFVAIAGVALETNGLAFRLPGDQQRLLSFTDTKVTAALQLDGYRMGVCLLEPRQDAGEFGASCRGSGARGTVLVWGDSHAAALAYGLRQSGASVSQYTASACPPLMDVRVRGRPHCASVNLFVAQQLATLAPSAVLLHARWRAYGEQDPVAHIGRTIELVRQVLPSAALIVVGPVPQWDPTLPDYLVRQGVGLDGELFAVTPLLEDLSAIDAALGSEVTRRGVRYVSPIRSLCSEGRCLAIVDQDGQKAPLVWDYGHLTAGGAAFLAARLALQH